MFSISDITNILHSLYLDQNLITVQLFLCVDIDYTSDILARSEIRFA